MQAVLCRIESMEIATCLRVILDGILIRIEEHVLDQAHRFPARCLVFDRIHADSLMCSFVIIFQFKYETHAETGISVDAVSITVVIHKCESFAGNPVL